MLTSSPEPGVHLIASALTASRIGTTASKSCLCRDSINTSRKCWHGARLSVPRNPRRVWNWNC